MPTYVYRRDDGTTFELQQRITEEALATCPTTGQAVTRVPSRGAGFVLKGSGFYQTDYKPSPKAEGSASGTLSSEAGANPGAPAGTNTEGGTTAKTDTPAGD